MDRPRRIRPPRLQSFGLTPRVLFMPFAPLRIVARILVEAVCTMGIGRLALGISNDLMGGGSRSSSSEVLEARLRNVAQADALGQRQRLGDRAGGAHAVRARLGREPAARPTSPRCSARLLGYPIDDRVRRRRPAPPTATAVARAGPLARRSCGASRRRLRAGEPEPALHLRRVRRSAIPTGSRMPPRRRSPKPRPAPTTRCSCTAASGWARPI